MCSSADLANSQPGFNLSEKKLVIPGLLSRISQEHGSMDGYQRHSLPSQHLQALISMRYAEIDQIEKTPKLEQRSSVDGTK